MNSRLARLIDSLKSASRDRNPASLAEWETILREIAALDDPECIHPLVLLLEDDTSLNELMFSIVHSIEVFKDDIYVEAMFRSLPQLARKAPRWAKILHMRILNAQSTAEAYAERFRRALPAEKAAARDVLLGVCESRPEFTDRVNAVLRGECDAGSTLDT